MWKYRCPCLTVSQSQGHPLGGLRCRLPSNWILLYFALWQAEQVISYLILLYYINHKACPYGASYIILIGTIFCMTHKIDGHPSDWARQGQGAAHFTPHICTPFFFITSVAFWFLLSGFYLNTCLRCSHEDLLVAKMWPSISKLKDTRQFGGPLRFLSLKRQILRC